MVPAQLIVLATASAFNVHQRIVVRVESQWKNGGLALGGLGER